MENLYSGENHGTEYKNDLVIDIFRNFLIHIRDKCNNNDVKIRMEEVIDNYETIGKIYATIYLSKIDKFLGNTPYGSQIQEKLIYSFINIDKYIGNLKENYIKSNNDKRFLNLLQFICSTFIESMNIKIDDDLEEGEEIYIGEFYFNPLEYVSKELFNEEDFIKFLNFIDFFYEYLFNIICPDNPDG